MDLWHAALLGLVQGLTEFFPVSSDGHLVAIARWLGARQDGSGASFEAFLHVGTLLACLVAFRRELAEMVPLLVQPRRVARGAPGDEVAQDVRFVVVGSVATALCALPLLDLFDAAYDRHGVLVACLAINGGLLGAARFAARAPARPASVVQALCVGVVQALAVLPGISRSCSTVVVGLLVGIPLARVAGLSFLLSLPAVVGATAIELWRHPPERALWTAIVTGIAVAFASGLFAVRAMLHLVPRRRMHHFAPYMLAFALAVWLAGA